LVACVHCQFLQSYPTGVSYSLTDFPEEGYQIFAISATQRTKLALVDSNTLVSGSGFTIQTSLQLDSGTFGIGFRDGLNSTMVWRIKAGMNPTVEVVYESEELVQQWVSLPVSRSIASQLEVEVQVTLEGSMLRTICTINGQNFVAEIPEQFFPTVSDISLHLDAGSEATLDSLMVEGNHYLRIPISRTIETQLTSPTQVLPSECSDGGSGANLLDVTLRAGEYVVETCGGNTDFDTQIKIYDGPCYSPTGCLGENDDACGSASQVTFTSPGTPICIGVSGFNEARGTYTLQINESV